MFDLAILGRAILPNSMDEGDQVAILINRGKIHRIIKLQDGEKLDREINSSKVIFDYRDEDILIFPSAIDAQVHSRSQKDNEGFFIASKQALKGGISTIIEMPYDEGLLISNALNFNIKKDEGLKESLVDFALYATIDPSDGTSKIPELISAGACGFKFSLFGTDPKRFPRIPTYLLHEAFSVISKSGLLCGVHNEDDESIKFLIDKIKRERQDYLSHNLSRPTWTENIATALVFELGVDTGARSHIVHISNSRACELALSYRSQGYHASLETCLHYLILSQDEDVKNLEGKAKVNPPIRNKEYREQLWKYLRAGVIDCVSTDHVSWSIDKKINKDMFKNSSGATGLEVLLPLLLTHAKIRGVSFKIIANVLSRSPARLFNLLNKGSIEVGKDADIVILQKHNHTYYSREGYSHIKYSIYDGFNIEYRVKSHFIRGQLLFDNNEILTSRGGSHFISPGDLT